MAQLSLPLWLANKDETFASFWIGDNHLLLAAVHDLLETQQSGYLYCWSRSGSGRTHLLNAACAQLSSSGAAAGYVPLHQRKILAPEMLDGMEQLALVCLDNIGHIAGDQAWEIAIFNLFNRMHAQPASRLIITADKPPRQLDITLPDLASRLDWGHIYKLQPLADQHKLKALQLRAHLRGFDLPEDVGQFLIKRLDRDMQALCRTLDTLDRASFSAQRKLTIPFVKDTLAL